MGLFFRERRGPAWKHGWTEQTLASVSAPPLPLLAIFGIIILLLTLSSYINYRLQMQQSMMQLKLFLLILPLLLILAAQLIWYFRLGMRRSFIWP
ncbi:Transmembrane protein [Melia azedarach]|uniref:Transmembrane protein n=1 Tax=Melia azedarach TaxID=155640 RepID=A0ACC1YIR1_MELAZ|nr:Transmembrane protein [Melia azedarach]